MSAARAARRRAKNQAAPVTDVELRAAAEIAMALPEMMLRDVVIATTPDGQQAVVMGRDKLDKIIAQGVPQNLKVEFVPVTTLEVAAALERVLGDDGTFSKGTFGGTVYGGQVGHA